MKNYEEMSDFEINKAVAVNRGGYQGHVEHMPNGVMESDKGSHGMFYTERDYCNNPSDAFPIILQNKITVFSPNCTHDDGLWMAELDEWHSFCANPLRAAMIVYLMMQDASK